MTRAIQIFVVETPFEKRTTQVVLGIVTQIVTYMTYIYQRDLLTPKDLLYNHILLRVLIIAQ